MAKKGKGPMLHNDAGSVAFMPQSIKYQSWPRAPFGEVNMELNDTISGIDSQMQADVSQARKNMNPKKF